MLSRRTQSNIIWNRKGKYRRSLCNIFDTTVVDSAHVSEYLRLADADTIRWIVPKEKIVAYIQKGYYDVLKNKDSLVISFYQTVAETEVRRYKIRNAYLSLSENNVRTIYPYWAHESYNEMRDNLDFDKIYEEKVDL